MKTSWLFLNSDPESSAESVCIANNSIGKIDCNLFGEKYPFFWNSCFGFVECSYFANKSLHEKLDLQKLLY
jgi:hypothetical protein